MSPLPITEYPSGSRVKISALDAGHGARSRLCALGLIPGTVVEVTDCGAGPCRLKFRGSDLVLGHGLASKILAIGDE